jgi:tripartite-type tricarboxylate transporter receptor subunit TctC
MITIKTVFAVATLIGVSQAVMPAPAYAQETFEGKTITISIGSSAGGGLDTYARLVARHFSKHIPGNPNVIPQNVPGAGGNIVASQIFNLVPKDGTSIGITFPGILIDPILNTDARPDFDPSSFQFLGSAHSEVLVCMVNKASGFQDLNEALETEIVIGATAPGSTTSHYPAVANNVLDTKFRVIAGYNGSREVTNAVERDEVQGICGVGWSTIKVQVPDALADESFAHVFAQEDTRGHPELNAAGVPLMYDLAKTDEQRQVLEWFYSQNSFARPFILPPEVPAATVEMLRTAFDATMADPELLADAAGMGIDVQPRTGSEVQDLIQRMYSAPDEIVQKVRDAIN